MYSKTKSSRSYLRRSLEVELVFLICICGSLAISSGAGADDFCYNKPSCGPSTWDGSCQRGKDGHQSPINIDLQKYPPSKKSSSITLSLGYSQPQSKFYLKKLNTSIEISLASKNPEKAYFTSDGLNGKYIFEQLHFHWGLKNDGTGSEDSINGKFYSMELHAVHYSSKFSNYDEAQNSGQPGALAVIGVLFKLRKNKDNKFLSPILAGIPKAKPDGSKTEVDQKLSLDKFFPKPNAKTGARTFARYSGSLTTPPCSEVVVHTVIIDRNYVSKRQLKVFQDLKDGAGEPIGDNFRPRQPLGNRSIEISTFELIGKK